MQDDRDMTTRPSEKKDRDPRAPIEKSGTAKQPKHDKGAPGPASDDPSE